MNDALNALYNFAMTHRQAAYLTDGEYQSALSLFGRLQDELTQTLAPEQQTLLKKLCDAREEIACCEQESMFCAAWSVFREL